MYRETALKLDNQMQATASQPADPREERNIARETIHSLGVVLASAAVMIGISWGAMAALTAENSWLSQVTEAAASEISTQAMSAYNN